MNDSVTSLFEESINLELSVSNIYACFLELFPGDADFWWKLVLEEKNHAALIQSGKLYFATLGEFPQELLAPVLRNLKDTNNLIMNLTEKYANTPPSREEAFNIAYKIENSAGEIHFQKFMDERSDSKKDNIFKELNKNDKDHAMRIRRYMEEHGILLQPNEGNLLTK